MPNATTNLATKKRHELKTLPEGFVELRKMTYGETLHRQDLSLNVTGTQTRGKDPELRMAAVQTTVTQYEWVTCIVNHNLEDPSGRKLDFRIASDFAMVDPTVGGEVSRLIDELIQDADTTLFREGQTSDSVSEATES